MPEPDPPRTWPSTKKKSTYYTPARIRAMRTGHYPPNFPATGDNRGMS